MHGAPANDGTLLDVIDEIRRSNVFKNTGSGTVGATDAVGRKEQMIPFMSRHPPHFRPSSLELNPMIRRVLAVICLLAL